MSAVDPSEATMWLSTRRRFRHGEPQWDEFCDFVGLSHLSEVRSIDSSLNPCIEGNFAVATLSDHWEMLASLPGGTGN